MSSALPLPPQHAIEFPVRRRAAHGTSPNRIRNRRLASFAADVNAEAGAFMADSQVPWGVDALNGAVSRPAWKTKPSWYLVATDDKMIAPDAQRAMSRRAGATVVEVAGSHAVYVSQPQAVAALVKQAAVGALATTPRWPRRHDYREAD